MTEPWDIITWIKLLTCAVGVAALLLIAITWKGNESDEDDNG